MDVIFFGNRGSRPTGAFASSAHNIYGGDTTSIGLVCSNRLVAIDAGTGAAHWPQTLNRIKPEGTHNLSVFFSHFYLDHTIGLPQSSVLFDPRNTVDLFALRAEENGQRTSLQGMFKTLANEPFNPDLEAMGKYKARINYNDLSARDGRNSINLADDIAISWMAVGHGDVTVLGYKVEHDGCTATIISDAHHRLTPSGKPVIDARLVEFIRGSDLLVWDSHYTDAEFAQSPEMCRHFGHSSGEHGVRLAHMARFPAFAAHHHNPAKPDDVLTQDMKALQLYGLKLGVAVLTPRPQMRLDLKEFLNRDTQAQVFDQAFSY
jgi:ribonuclease BN (tRNA processing enzyme)